MPCSRHFQLGSVAGPTAAGLLLAGAGIRFVYWADVASFGAAMLAVFLITPQPLVGSGHPPGLRSIVEGFTFTKGRQAIQGVFLIDINATSVRSPPRPLCGDGGDGISRWPVNGRLSLRRPGAGALLGALATGWVSRVRHQGQAVIIAVVVWGLAIAAFGLVAWLPAALVLLAMAGWADVISAVLRNTIIQLAAPDTLRGRLTGLQMAVVNGGPRLGDLEAGVAAAAFGDTVSVVSGGLACVAGALVLARLLPGFRRQRTNNPPDGIGLDALGPRT